MYAVFKTGGKQYRASVGDTLRVELLDQSVDEPVVFEEVLLLKRSDAGVEVGHPFLSDVSVRGIVVSVGRADKVHIFKMRRRKHYQKGQGHRQMYTEVRIDHIG